MRTVSTFALLLGAAFLPGKSLGEEFTVFLETEWGFGFSIRLSQEARITMAENNLTQEADVTLRRELKNLIDVRVVEEKKDAEFWIIVTLWPRIDPFKLSVFTQTRNEEAQFILRVFPHLVFRSGQLHGGRYSGGLVTHSWAGVGLSWFSTPRKELEQTYVEIISTIDAHIFEAIRRRSIEDDQGEQKSNAPSRREGDSKPGEK